MTALEKVIGYVVLAGLLLIIWAASTRYYWGEALAVAASLAIIIYTIVVSVKNYCAKSNEEKS